MIAICVRPLKAYTLFALSFVGRGVGITAAFRRSPFLLFSLSLSLSTSGTKCQTLNERYIFGPRGKTLSFCVWRN